MKMTCTSCKQKLEFEDKYMGTTFKCPNCGEKIKASNTLPPPLKSSPPPLMEEEDSLVSSKVEPLKGKEYCMKHSKLGIASSLIAAIIITFYFALIILIRTRLRLPFLDELFDVRSDVGSYIFLVTIAALPIGIALGCMGLCRKNELKTYAITGIVANIVIPLYFWVVVAFKLRLF